ncbi:hypothetical protein PSHT_05745 [Puccinia striiformis]|uniref:(2E,6E)-farnesyl diphosphate synthase n=1 Tax=Puccinia striiformis TaxID=27350 RepID=A0A2S4W9Q5_9BASI|nr:hypothetical protein PSHT_05745 [Puccinia striiformis]
MAGRLAGVGVPSSQVRCLRPEFIRLSLRAGGAMLSIQRQHLSTRCPAPPTLASLTSSLGRNNTVDPFRLLASELSQVKENVKALMGSGNQKLALMAKYCSTSARQGKHLRSLIILLISQATAPPSLLPSSCSYQHPEINSAISPPEILNDANPSQPTSTDSFHQHANILPTQRRLAEIAELLHVAILLQDDVVDDAETRRGQLSAPLRFGGKETILAANFLLARAMMALSRLGNLEVVPLIMSSICDIVEGEIIRFAPLINHDLDPISHSSSPPPLSTGESKTYSTIKFDDRLFDAYQKKNQLKTAAYISKFCRAAVLLSPVAGQDPTLVEASYEFGNHLGLAFQIVDDSLNCTSSVESFGKAGDFSDLKSGIITAPALFAWKEFGSEFGTFVKRKLSHDGDFERVESSMCTSNLSMRFPRAQKMIEESDGIKKSYKLATHHIDISKSYLNQFKDSQAKEGLHQICDLVLARKY